MNKKDLISSSKAKTISFLKQYSKYEKFLDSDIYILDIKYLKFFQELSIEFEAFKVDKTKKKALCLEHIVNLINPEHPAYQYNFTIAEKYVYMSNVEKCIKEARARVAIMERVLHQNLEEEFNNNPDYSESFKKTKRDELNKKIKEDQKRVNDIFNNPGLIQQIRICGYKRRKKYGQINWGYYTYSKDGNRKKNRKNKHLSIKYPNIVFMIEEDNEKHKDMMEAKYLEQQGFIEICKDIFVKYR